MTTRILTALLIMAILCCNSSGSQAVMNPAGNTAGQPQQSSVRPEDVLWSSAQECLQKAQYKEARQKLDQFIRNYRTNPRLKEAMFYQGLCDLKLGQEVQALSVWDQVVNLERTEKTKSKALLLTLEQLAGYYDRKGNEADKKKALNQLLAEFPDNPVTVSLHAQAAETRLKASDYKGALALYKPVAGKLSPEDRKNYELAEMLVSSAAMNPRVVLQQANAGLEKNNQAQAIRLYELLLKKESTGSLAAEAKTKLGWCYYLQKRFEDAEKLWQDVISRGSPGDEWVGQSRWHMIILTAGPYHKAEEARRLCSTQAQEFAGKFKGEQALFTRAWLYWVEKKWAEGKGAFDDLVRAYPEKGGQPTIQEYIRDCEQGIGMKKKGGS